MGTRRGMPLLRRVAFCQKGVSSQTFVKKLREIFYYPGAGRAGLEFSKCPASGLRIKTEIKGFPRNRTQTAAAAGPKFSKCPASGLRIKTEIKGFPRSRTQTVAAAGPKFSKCPASGLRIKTEINGFPGNRTQTGAAAGPAGVWFPVYLHKKGCSASAEQPFSLLELLKWLITEREP